MPDESPDATTAFRDLLARLASARRATRPALIRELLPHLADRRISPPERIAATARILRIIPDRLAPVRRVVRALTAGLSPGRAMDRLRQVQHRLVGCATLDALIDERATRLTMSCPRCHITLSRVEMVKHLWNEHGLILHGRRGHPPAKFADSARAEHAAGAREALERVVAWSGLAGLRRWLAADTPGEELQPVLDRAREHGTGLCPGCFHEVVPVVRAFPPPLTRSPGRLAGDGQAVAAGANAWFRFIRVTTAAGTTLTRIAPTARLAASLAAVLVLLVVQAVGPPRGFVLARLVGAVLAYLAVRLAWSVLDDRDGNADVLDAAWRLARRQVDDPSVCRFLTRLCLTSLGRDGARTRADVLAALVDRAAASGDAAERRLLAAARVLQWEDRPPPTRDVATLADLAATGFLGERPTDFAEAIASVYLAFPRPAEELARLRILLLVAAFQAGLTPRILNELWDAAPNLKRTMAMSEPRRKMLWELWKMRPARPWTTVGPAETVFDFARRSTAGAILAQFPDLLLVPQFDSRLPSAVSPVLVVARGVVVGKKLVSDPAAPLRQTASGRLVLGRHRLELSTRLPVGFLQTLRGWLRFRVSELAPGRDDEPRDDLDRTDQLLEPFRTLCPTCGTASVLVAGAVGLASRPAASRPAPKPDGNR